MVVDEMVVEKIMIRILPSHITYHLTTYHLIHHLPPLLNETGSTTIMFESTPLYPDHGRYWEMGKRDDDER